MYTLHVSHAFPSLGRNLLVSTRQVALLEREAAEAVKAKIAQADVQPENVRKHVNVSRSAVSMRGTMHILIRRSHPVRKVLIHMLGPKSLVYAYQVCGLKIAR